MIHTHTNKHTHENTTEKCKYMRLALPLFRRSGELIFYPSTLNYSDRKKFAQCCWLPNLLLTQHRVRQKTPSAARCGGSAFNPSTLSSDEPAQKQIAKLCCDNMGDRRRHRRAHLVVIVDTSYDVMAFSLDLCCWWYSTHVVCVFWITDVVSSTITTIVMYGTWIQC